MVQTVRVVALFQQASQMCRSTLHHQVHLTLGDPIHHQTTAQCTHVLSQTSLDESQRNPLVKLAVAAVQTISSNYSLSTRIYDFL